MATFNLSADRNWEDAVFSTRAGDDTYNLGGYKLTIDTDTRYCTNSAAATGTMGSVNDSASLGGELYIDGTKVRIIPYDTGSGNVPAIGTSITEGGVSGYLLGVWSALNVAPTAVGAAVPASGWIKVKNVTGGSYSAGALGGIGANATGADVVGWIEVAAHDASRVITLTRKGKFTMIGAWYDAGLTSGVTGQTIQLPASLALTYYPGVWIEDGDLIGAIADDGGVQTWELNASRDSATTGDVTLLPTTPAANDAYYFGYGTTFSSMDIVQSTAGNGVWTITWEYWNGAAWTALSGVVDGTSSFIGSTGALTVSWTLPGDWAQSTLYENKTAYWIRARVSAYTSVVTRPLATRVTVLNSGVYTFYPNNSGNTTTRQDIGGKVVWIDTQGLVTINNSGAAQNGFLPGRNLRVRVPNIVTLHANGAANAAIPATFTIYGARYRLTVTGGAAIDIARANISWALILTGAYSISIVDTGVCDRLLFGQNVTAPILTNVGVGIGYRTLTTVYVALGVMDAVTGATITDCVFQQSRSDAYSAAVSLEYSNDLDFVDCTVRYGQTRSGEHTLVNMATTNNCTFTDCSLIGGRVYQNQHCNETTFTRLGYLDNVGGVTTSAAGLIFYFYVASDNILIDGIHFMDVPNSNPYTAFVRLESYMCGNITIRNIGTYLHPLSAGPSATYASARIVEAGYARTVSVTMKRCYVTDLRAPADGWGINNAIINLPQSSVSNNLCLENIFVAAANAQTAEAYNSQVKGCRSAYWTTYTYLTLMPGIHFWDLFSSDTAGHLIIVCTEKTLEEPSASSYTVVTAGSGFGFTGIGNNGILYAPSVDDEIIWTWPWFILCHQRFDVTECTSAGVASIANPNNHDFWYDIDTGSDFSGVWKNLKYTRTGGATTNTSPTITMTDTTGVEVGDFVYGTNIPTNTIIIAVVNATTCTMSKAATGTGSGYTFRFNHIPLVGHVEVTLAAGGYVSCVAGDIGKVVSYSGGVPTDTGTLLAYDNTNRKWWITTTTDYTWSNTSTALVIATGTGTGTPSVAGTVEPVLPTTGFKIKVRMKTIVAAAGNTITRLDIPTITNTTFQALQYSLISEQVDVDIYAVTESGVAIENAQVAVYKSSDLSNIMNEDTNASGLATAQTEYNGVDIPIILRIRKSSPAASRYKNYDSVGTITSEGLVVTCVMQPDEVAT